MAWAVKPPRRSHPGARPARRYWDGDEALSRRAVVHRPGACLLDLPLASMAEVKLAVLDAMKTLEVRP